MEISFADSEPIVLTPAQQAFVLEHRPDFAPQTHIVTLAGYAGSDRRFYRISPIVAPAQSVILMVWQSIDPDWHRFIEIPGEIGNCARFLPQIYAVDEPHGLVIEEDLGDITLCSHCLRHGDDGRVALANYQRVIDALIAWQEIDVEHAPTISSRSMDEEMFIWESDYFALHCVSEFYGCDKGLSGEWHKERLALASMASRFQTVCIHRDFQSENILLDNDAIRFVDYQGARRGPRGYDLASLIYDPYVDVLTPSFSLQCFEYYQSMSRYQISQEEFNVCAAQRLMQALGAYGNLSIHKGKDRYRQFLPVALKRLHHVLSAMDDVTHLTGVVAACIEKSSMA